jgi:hypothetical protein
MDAAWAGVGIKRITILVINGDQLNALTELGEIVNITTRKE